MRYCAYQVGGLLGIFILVRFQVWWCPCAYHVECLLVVSVLVRFGVYQMCLCCSELLFVWGVCSGDVWGSLSHCIGHGVVAWGLCNK